MKLIIFCTTTLLTLIQGRVLEPDAYLGSRIINGENAKLGEIPYQVSLQIHGMHFCGGSIINNYWVVSAAHCVLGYRPENIVVIVGTIDLKNPYKKHQSIEIIAHRNYTGRNSYKDDISLIKVKQPFEFNEIVKPVTLPKPRIKVKTNSTVIISGWGYLANKTLPNLLQKVKVFVADQDYCRNVMQKYGMTVHQTQLCANDPTQRKGECNGDSGSPVTVNEQLEGIVSWSVKDPDCGSPIIPGVHTRVSEYVDWIQENLK